MKALFAWFWRFVAAWGVLIEGEHIQAVDDHEAAVEADRAALQSRSTTDDEVARAGDGAVRNELRAWSAGNDP